MQHYGWTEVTPRIFVKDNQIHVGIEGEDTEFSLFTIHGNGIILNDVAVLDESTFSFWDGATIPEEEATKGDYKISWKKMERHDLKWTLHIWRKEE